MNKERPSNGKADKAKAEPDVSRRKFLAGAVAGAGITAVSAIGGDKVLARDASAEREIKIPEEFALAKHLLNFGLTLLFCSLVLRKSP